MTTGGTNARFWTRLKRRVNLEPPAVGEREADLARRIFSLLQANDPTRLAAWQTALGGGQVDARHVQMRAYQLLPTRTELIAPSEFLARVSANPVVRAIGSRDQQPAGTYAREVLEPLRIDLSWLPSRPEGNNKSLKGSKKLFAIGEQVGPLGEDTLMLHNHKSAIECMVDAVPAEGITVPVIVDLQAKLMKDH